MQLFGDNLPEIRELSTGALNMAMKSMSAFGVKQILPILLEGCHDKNWRTKVSNLAALGSMSHLATKQLASSLPKIVPQLTLATTDTNPQIKESAVNSMS